MVSKIPIHLQIKSEDLKTFNHHLGRLQINLNICVKLIALVCSHKSGNPELDYLNQTAKEDYWERDSVYYGQDIISVLMFSIS